MTLSIELVPLRLFSARIADGWTMVPGYNPSHLRWATPSSNMRDRDIDGTTFIATGERQGASKLTEQDVAGIRASNKPQKELAELYGVSKQQISKIVRRERWTHV